MSGYRQIQREVFFSKYQKQDESESFGDVLSFYTPPKAIKVSVCGHSDNSSIEDYGNANAGYIKLLFIGKNCSIDKNSILWIDKKPDNLGENGRVKHNYEVEKISKTVNTTVIVCREVYTE